MHLARLPKQNGKRGRMVVFTHGAKSTVVVQGALLSLALHYYVTFKIAVTSTVCICTYQYNQSRQVIPSDYYMLNFANR